MFFSGRGNGGVRYSERIGDRNWKCDYLKLLEGVVFLSKFYIKLESGRLSFRICLFLRS